MAQAIGCDLCQQEAAVMMQSNLTNGDTVGVGEACMITFFAGGLVGMLDQLSADQLAAITPLLSGVTDAIGLRPSDEMPRQAPEAASKAPEAASVDDGHSGNESAGALTKADIDQLDAAEADT